MSVAKGDYIIIWKQKWEHIEARERESASRNGNTLRLEKGNLQAEMGTH